jgi:hypothetical protein
MPLFKHLEGLTFGNLNWHLWMGCKYFLVLVVNVHYLKVDNSKGLVSFWYVVYVVFLCVWRFEVWHLGPYWHLWMVVAYLLSIFNAQGVWVEKAHLHLSMVVAFCSIEGWHLRWMIWNVCLVVNVDCFHYWMLTKLSYNIYV